MTTKTFIANIRGIQGIQGTQGVQGIPGFEAVPTDQGVAALFTLPSATQTALINAALKDPAGVMGTKPLRVFSSDFLPTYPGSGVLADWQNISTGTAAYTLAASTRTDGGNTCTLTDPDTGSLAIIKRVIPSKGGLPQWFTLDEVTVPATQSLTVELGSGSSRRASIIVNNSGANTVSLRSSDQAGATTLVPNVNASTGFDSTKAFRLAIWYDPRTGEARFYIFYDVAGTTRHAYMGNRMNDTLPYALTYVQMNTGAGGTGNVPFARAEMFEVRGIIHGCSVDLANNVYDTSPNRFTFQSRYNDAARALGLRLWGQQEGIVNMAHGGWTVEQMRDGSLSSYGEDTATWANMVTALRPEFVIIGSPINSVAAASTLSPPSTAADNRVVAAQVAYKQLIDATFAAGVKYVIVRNCSPVGGNVTFDTSAKLDLVDTMNAWMATLPGLYPGRLVLSDVWAAMKDPANPRYLLPLYDVGDHIHYTVAGAEALALADARAILPR